MIKAEELAKRWMIGTRENSTREAWRHPEDITKKVEYYYSEYKGTQG